MGDVKFVFDIVRMGGDSTNKMLINNLYFILYMISVAIILDTRRDCSAIP